MGNPNIDELDGPELNKAIAKSVFGWSIYHFNDARSYYMLVDAAFSPVGLTYGTAPFQRYSNYEHATEDNAWAKDCPDFCQDIAAAWLVWEKLPTRIDDVLPDVLWRLDRVQPGLAHVSMGWVWSPEPYQPENEQWFVWGVGSAPLAICRAALTAVQVPA